MKHYIASWSGTASSVTLIDAMGDEDRICQVARISYNREDAKEGSRLIAFLLEQKHMSPFEHVEFEFFIHTPIPIRTQLFRHRMASPNELSGRFVSSKDSGIYFPNAPMDLQGRLQSIYKASLELYSDLLASGIPREAARMVLLQGQMTKFYFKVNARSLINIFEQRLSDHAQQEMVELATIMFNAFEYILPTVAERFTWMHPVLYSNILKLRKGIVKEEDPWNPKMKGVMK